MSKLIIYQDLDTGVVVVTRAANHGDKLRRRGFTPLDASKVGANYWSAIRQLAVGVYTVKTVEDTEHDRTEFFFSVKDWDPAEFTVGQWGKLQAEVVRDKWARYWGSPPEENGVAS